MTTNSRKPTGITLRNGNRHSADVYNALSPEEKKAFNEKKRDKRMITTANRKALKSFRESLEAVWKQNPEFLAALNNMTVVQMTKAIQGDTAAYTAVMSYTVGKPTERTQVTQDTKVTFDNLSQVDDDELIEIAINNLRNDNDQDD